LFYLNLSNLNLQFPLELQFHLISFLDLRKGCPCPLTAADLA
jgi:hypothetical protein